MWKYGRLPDTRNTIYLLSFATCLHMDRFVQSVRVNNEDISKTSTFSTGDLITSDSVYMQTDIISAHPLGVWDVGSQRQNANLMMCICDWIVPGHDTVFQVNTFTFTPLLPHKLQLITQVTEAHRLKASCSRLNLTKLLANRS